MAPYPYPTPNSQLISDLNLHKHPEGGYFVQTDCQAEEVSSPFAVGKAARPLATSIYYLLTPESPVGFLHMNKSVTYHVLHQGRAEYTLIHPGTPPRVERVRMGTDAAAGERRQLLVGTGVWKMSRIPAADLRDADSGEAANENAGCLITEVVVPGFVWDDHAYLTMHELRALFGGSAEEERWVDELKEFVRRD